MTIKNNIAGSTRAAGKYLLFMLAFVGIAFTSCKEEDGTDDEYANWQSRNETYFNSKYTEAEANADGNWKIIRSYSKEEASATAKTDFILVHIEEEGTGTESPIYTDSVRVHYRGNLIPSESYSAGYQFDSSWTGDYNQKTMKPSSLYVGGLVNGFTTALMNMHKGDRWTVYIPYSLGYGATAQTSIPAYSTLKFDITLVDFVHKGKSFPTFQ